MFLQTACVSCPTMQAVVQNELILCSRLNIVSRLQLPIAHVIIFHSHEGGIFINFGEAVSALKSCIILLILLLPWDEVCF
jgi:hypothetical protein